MSKDKVNKLTNASKYDVNRMMFSDPVSGTIPNSVIAYQRIQIGTVNDDGTTGDLILPTGRIFSFGVSENLDPDTKKLKGHTLPLCLWGRDGASKLEKAWTDTFDAIAEHCKQYVMNNKEELGYYDITMQELKKMNPLYWKKDKGKVVVGTGPTLYAKIIASKKHDKILSIFSDMRSGLNIDPLTLLNKYCYVIAAVKIESVYIGAGGKFSLQVKLYEAEVEIMDAGIRSILPRADANARVLTGNNMIGDEDGGSLNNSDAEDEPPAKKPEPPVEEAKKKIKFPKKAT